MPAFTLTLSATGTFDIIDEPIINGFSPTTGKYGDTINITGSNFKNISSVTLAGLTAESYTVLSSTKIHAKLPTGNSSVGKVTITTVGGTSTSKDNFTFIGTPSISAINPTAGIIGSTVSITGNNLSNVNSVTYTDNKVATFSVVSNNELSTQVPVGTVTGPITIKSLGGDVKSNTFTVTSSFLPPTINSFTPSSGSINTLVKIIGSKLLNASSVKVNNVESSFKVNSDSNIDTTIPNNATTGKISVTTPGGTSYTVTNFEVVNVPTITSFTPTAVFVGDKLRITGTNYTNVSSVKINNIDSSYSVISSTTIDVIVPNTTSGKITIKALGGSVTSTTDLIILQKPTITGFSPNTGGIGTTVNITGNNFSNITAVKFNNVDASSFNVINSTTINAVVATGTTSGKITVTNAIGTAISTSDFTVASLSPLTWTPSNKTINWYTERNYGGQENSNITQANFASVNNLTVKTIEFNNRNDSTSITAINNLNNYPNLATLDLTYQDLPTINISGNTNLQDLYVSYNEFTSFNLSTNAKLVNVDVSENSIAGNLNASNCTSLQNLNCSSNYLLGLNLTGTDNLISLDCSSNSPQFNTLDLNNKVNLQTLNCQENGLTTLYINNCTSLVNVNCYVNSLTGTIALNNLTKLQSFIAYQNSIIQLSLGTINNLQQLDLSFNSLSGILDLSNLSKLEFLDLRKNKLTSVKLSATCISTSNQFTFTFADNNLDVDSVNNILITLDSYNKSGNYLNTLSLEGGTNASPSGAGITAKNNLISKGWSVTTN